MTKTPTKNKRLGEAAPSYFGFSLQLNRMLLMLLKARPGDVAWLEKFDDVGLTCAQGEHVVEQDATYLSKNPLTDNAEKLYKTFANWVVGAQQKWFDPASTNFHFFVLQKHKLGNLAGAMSATHDGAGATACLNAIRDFHWGKEPKFAKKSALPESLAAHLDIILAYPTTSIKIIERCKISCGSGDPIADLDAEISANPFCALIGPARRTHFIEGMLGWLKVKTDSQMASGDIAHVTFAELQEVISRYLRQHLQTSYLRSLARTPTGEEAEAVIRGEPNFVRQLKLIEYDQTAVISSVNAYLMAREDMAKWALDSEVSETDFDKYQAELKRQWRFKKDALPEDISDVVFGRRLAAGCFQETHPIAGKPVEGTTFTEGMYHDLANADSDKLEVGWHRDFKNLLK